HAAQRYAELLDGLVHLPATDAGNTHVHAVYTVCSEQKAAIRSHMQEAGVPTAAYYEHPLHLEPVFAKLGHGPGSFPVAERLGSEGFCLPMHPFIGDTELEQVAAAMRAGVAASGGGGR
ncbi:MAG: DegT/DnrJ/EryC1/StrS family aminotransferase, partial [Planctomycetota bacterium]